MDARPLEEAASPHAGALATSRVYRSLGLPDLIAANLRLSQRQRGFAESQMVESITLLQTIGGDCPEDIRLLAQDPCLERGLGYRPPKATAVRRVEDRAWQTFGQEGDGTLRQWAEVDFVPGDRSEHKDSQPLRYVGLRLLKPQGVLFADGSDRHFHAVVTNRTLDGGRLLDWHREKAGTVEHVHDEVRNWLGGGHMPGQHFAVNAAWFKLALLTYNLASATRGLCFSVAEGTVRMKKFRLLLIHLAGRMNRNNCVMGLRLCASVEAIARMQQVWAVFELPTQATAAVALGRGKGGRGG